MTQANPRNEARRNFIVFQGKVGHDLPKLICDFRKFVAGIGLHTAMVSGIHSSAHWPEGSTIDVLVKHGAGMRGNLASRSGLPAGALRGGYGIRQA